MDFTRTIIGWYRINRRDLPWRSTRDPYLIWVSEIILQQTRIDQGLPYYLKIVEKFPDIRSLAQAEEQELLRLWQGLGYYSRARNMHAAARQVVRESGGVFPDTFGAIRSLRGVGEYTAAAIGSIAFGLCEPVVDGNVLRFFARFFGIRESIDSLSARKRIRETAARLIDRDHPGDFNQAIMEFGARVCTPADPGCERCDFRNECVAFGENLTGVLPVRKGKMVASNRFIHYLVITAGSGDSLEICLNHRTSRDIWRNLYDFPEFHPEKPEQTDRPLKPGRLLRLFEPDKPQFLGVVGPRRHLLTHRKLHVWFYRFHFTEPTSIAWSMVKVTDLHLYPVPKLIDRFLRDFIIFVP